MTSDNVIILPTRQRRYWVCNCGCATSFLYEDGSTECAACGKAEHTGAFKNPPGREIDGVEETSVNRVFDDPIFVRRSLARELESPELVGACLIFRSGRVRSVVNEYADSDERRVWWRQRAVDFLNHVFGMIIKP